MQIFAGIEPPKVEEFVKSINLQSKKLSTNENRNIIFRSIS